MNAVTTDIHVPQQSKSVLLRMAERYGIDPAKMLDTLKATAFKGNVSNEQMMALCVVAEQYGLNPWTKEIYAFPDSRNGIVPVVGVDGWSRIINSNPAFDGMYFVQDAESCTCRIHRKDRSHPIEVTEWLSECLRDAGPWKSHPKRMLRHKAMIQCARIAFGFVGIYDEDEAERIIDVTPVTKVDPRGDLSEVDMTVANKHVAVITDLLAQGKDEFSIADDLRTYEQENLARFNELYMVVQDELAKRSIISKANWKKYLKLQLGPEGRDHA
jgi:hypothetical protein